MKFNVVNFGQNGAGTAVVCCALCGIDGQTPSEGVVNQFATEFLDTNDNHGPNKLIVLCCYSPSC